MGGRGECGGERAEGGEGEGGEVEDVDEEGGGEGCDESAGREWAVA